MINLICLTLKVFFYYIVEVPPQFFKNKEGEVMKKKKNQARFWTNKTLNELCDHIFFDSCESKIAFL